MKEECKKCIHYIRDKTLTQVVQDAIALFYLKTKVRDKPRHPVWDNIKEEDDAEKKD